MTNAPHWRRRVGATSICSVAGQPRVFISYRRSDSSGHAGRIYDALCHRFGRDSIFFDVDSIAPGRDFVHALEDTLDQATVVLVVIGPGWVDAEDGSGGRRIDDPSDYVRREVAQALARGEDKLPVVPVLVNGATMPAEQALPSAISALPRRNAKSLFDEAFGPTMESLIASLERSGGSTADEPKVGSKYDGHVVSLSRFGVFVNILPGIDGLVHVSRMGVQRVEDVSVGDTLKVRVHAIDKDGKVSLALAD